MITMSEYKSSSSFDSPEDIVRFLGLIVKQVHIFFSKLISKLFSFVLLVLFLLKKNYLLSLLIIGLGAFLGWFFQGKFYPPFTYKIRVRTNFESAVSLYNTIRDWNSRGSSILSRQNILNIEVYPVKSESDVLNLYYTAIQGKGSFLGLEKLDKNNLDGLPVKYRDFSKKVDSVSFKDHILLIHTLKPFPKDQNFQKILIDELNKGEVLVQKNTLQKDILNYKKAFVERELKFFEDLIVSNLQTEKKFKSKEDYSKQDNYATLVALYEKATEKLITINNELSTISFSIEPLCDLKLIENNTRNPFRGVKQGMLLAFVFCVAALLFHRFFPYQKCFSDRIASL